jgi:hypothetical protein
MDFDETQVGQRRSTDDGNLSCTSNGSLSSGVASFRLAELVLDGGVVVISVDVDVELDDVELSPVEVFEVLDIIVVVVLDVLSITGEGNDIKDVDSYSGVLIASIVGFVDDWVLVTNSSGVVEVDVVVVLSVDSSDVVVVSTDVDIPVVDETNVSSGSSEACSRAMSRTSLTI